MIEYGEHVAMSWPTHPEPERLKTDWQKEQRQLEAELAEARAKAAEFERELEETRPKLAELTNERIRLEGANWALQFELRGWRQQVERLARQVYETRQERETVHELNRQLQAQLRETKHVLDELDGKHRLDDLEKSVKAIYQSRIWQTLVALSSPVEKLFRSRGK
jgi:chromosome segregation ATPase